MSILNIVLTMEVYAVDSLYVYICGVLKFSGPGELLSSVLCPKNIKITEL
jgi:hypothetical protein